MMYYASKTIHAANPNAVAIMSTIDAYGGDMKTEVAEYMGLVYKNIKSSKFGNGSINTDDYFQCLSWNPYYCFREPDDQWLAYNNAAYDVVKKYGDDGKKVFLSEFGYTDMGDVMEDAKFAEWFRKFFNYVEKMDYVAGVTVFRMFNELESTWNGLGERYFGLFGEKSESFYPKKRAIALQDIYGGNGDLWMYSDKYK